jgi:hypothetical protein
MATADPLSTVIGVFPSVDQAEKAIDELRRARFSYERIRLVERGTGSFFDSLKGMFTGQGAVASNTADNLTKMGLPEYEARHYQNELDAHHVLVLMNADERPEDAFSIMRQNGAFDLNMRLRTNLSDSATVNGATDEARDVRAQDEASNVRAQEEDRDVRAQDEASNVRAQEETASTYPVTNAPASTPRTDRTDTSEAPVSNA